MGGKQIHLDESFPFHPLSAVPYRCCTVCVSVQLCETLHPPTPSTSRGRALALGLGCRQTGVRECPQDAARPARRLWSLEPEEDMGGGDSHRVTGSRAPRVREEEEGLVRSPRGRNHMKGQRVGGRVEPPASTWQSFAAPRLGWVRGA